MDTELTAEKLDTARAKIEAQMSDGRWDDLTQYLEAGSVRMQHSPDWGPPFPDPMRPRTTRWERTLRDRMYVGPTRRTRAMDYRARAASLPERLKITEGTGNWMVNICQSGTRQAAQDKAARAFRSMRKDMHHPNERLRTYGLKIELDEHGRPVVTGGTARQRACYLRAVDRWIGQES